MEKQEKKALSFNKGLRAARYGDIETIREEITSALAIRCRQTYSNRKNGKIKHTPAEMECIERIFAKHDVTECWGN